MSVLFIIVLYRKNGSALLSNFVVTVTKKRNIKSQFTSKEPGNYIFLNKLLLLELATLKCIFIETFLCIHPYLEH